MEADDVSTVDTIAQITSSTSDLSLKNDSQGNENAPSKLNETQAQYSNALKRKKLEPVSPNSKYKELERVQVNTGPLESFIVGSQNLINKLDEEIEEARENNNFELRSSSNTPTKKLKKKPSLKNFLRLRSASAPSIKTRRKKNDEYAKNLPSIPQTEKDLQKEDTEKERRKWWNRWADHIKYSIISKETEEAFYEIVILLKQFSKDFELRPIDITMCLMLLNTYYASSVIRTEKRVYDVTFLSKTCHYMKYACSAYGWKLVYGYQWKKATKGLLEGFKHKDSVNIKILQELTGISENDVVCTQWKSGHFCPGHFIAVDHAHKSVVLSIRGTFHAKDALTDLLAKYDPFMGGFVHSGILMAARQKFRDVVPTLLETLKQHPGYELILVGHSLGAGTASLLAMLIYSEYNIPLHCFAFAPPGVMSLDLAHKCRNFITSIVLNDDIIPRLSCGSIADLKQVILHLMSQTDSNLKRMFQFLSAGNNLGQGLTRKLSNYFSCSPTPDLQNVQYIPEPRLYPPGRTFLIFNPDNKKGLATKYNAMEESDPSLFGDIIISSSMFTDHMPDAYETALETILETVKKNEGIPLEETIAPCSLPQCLLSPIGDTDDSMVTFQCL